ncbi:MAG: DinB family protein [Chloroflexi bacterium]|nr:MAG: DinB family protein [Chloroflexota bacterium]
MPHPLVFQLRFARSEFARCLEGVPPKDAVRRAPPMNSLSWIVGHLAGQESAYWVLLAQGQKIHPELRDLAGTGRPASTPPLEEMWFAWREVTAAADIYLDTLTVETLQTRFIWKGEPYRETVGTLLLRNLYHYWYHTGEAAGIRQALGHTDLPDFIGDLGIHAPYLPE